MTTIAPGKGFDWKHVAWGAPDAPPSALCSYCSAKIDDDDVPLMLWRPDGGCAKFCLECIKKWWGGT